MTIPVNPGDIARATVLWRNTGAIPFSPHLRYDLRRSGFGSTWIEGSVVSAPSLNPGGQGEAEVYCQVPTDWLYTMIDAKLMVQGLEGAQWQEDDVYQTTEDVYELIQHTIHPAAYVWEGEAEVCVFEFQLGPEQIPFTQWGGRKLAETFANTIEAEGNSILELKVYEDTTPTFWTNYRIEIKAAVASEEQGVAVWPWLIAIGAVLVKLPWAFIIKGTLVLIGLWLVGWVIEKVDRVIHKPSPLTDEVIDALGREDLIPMILYKAPSVGYEVLPEDLEGMTDDGLRALLKDLRDRQEKAFPWGLVAIGGIAALGVGTAIALTRKKD